MCTSINNICKSLPPEHKKKTNQILNLLYKSNNINGIFYCGSMSNLKSDKLSDLDIIAICDQPSTKSRNIFQSKIQYLPHSFIFLNINNLPQFGDLLSIYFKPNLLFSVDIGFIDTLNLNKVRLEPYGKIIKDTENNILNHLKNNKTHPLKRNYLNDLWLNLWKVRKALLRNDLWNSNEYLNRARNSIIGHIRSQYEEEFYPDRPYHKINNVIPHNILNQFNDTFPKLDICEHISTANKLIDISNTFSKHTKTTKKILTLLRKDINNIKIT